MSGVPFPAIEARGSYRQIGRAVGEAARPQIEAAVEYYRHNFPAISGLTFEEARRQAQEYLLHARRHLPRYVEELEGMAEASGVPFDDLLVPNCAEEFTCATDDGGGMAPSGPRAARAGRLCTAVAVAAGGRHIVGHNMDWYAVDLDKNVLFDVTCPDGTRFLTIAGVPYLPILGMSSHGVGYVGNSLHCTDYVVGVPNVFVRRWALEAPTVDELRTRACTPFRARGSNHLLADSLGRIVDVETSATADATMEAGEWSVHTNHYVDETMLRFEASWSQESCDRLERARAMVGEGLARGDDPLELVAAVLRDHAHAPGAICAHPASGEPDPAESITVASMICDLDNGRLHACAGPPCENPYRVFEL